MGPRKQGSAATCTVTDSKGTGTRTLLFMSKGMGPHDKWIGERNGRIYLEK